MGKSDLDLAKGFIKYCRDTKGEIGEVALSDSVFELISNAINSYGDKQQDADRLSKEIADIDKTLNKAKEVLGDTQKFGQIRKFNFNKLRNRIISATCAKLLYDLFHAGLTINNSNSQIESYKINVLAEKDKNKKVFKYRLRAIGDIIELEELLNIIQQSALIKLDDSLLEVALDMNLKVYIPSGVSLAQLRLQDNWKACESLVIDLGLNGLIIDLNKELNNTNKMNTF